MFPLDHRIIFFYFKSETLSSSKQDRMWATLYEGLKKFEKAGARVEIIDITNKDDLELYNLYSLVPKFQIELGLYLIPPSERKGARKKLLFSCPFDDKVCSSDRSFKPLLIDVLNKLEVNFVWKNFYKFSNGIV